MKPNPYKMSRRALIAEVIESRSRIAYYELTLSDIQRQLEAQGLSLAVRREDMPELLEAIRAQAKGRH